MSETRERVRCLTEPSYVRFTFYLGFLSNASDIMIFPSSDTSIVSYTAYDEKNVCVKKSCLPVTEIKAFLPGEICVAVGRTIEMYNSQVCPNASNYHFKWKCQIGKALQRKFSVTGFSDNVGTYTLELEIYDNENIIALERLFDFENCLCSLIRI